MKLFKKLTAIALLLTLFACGKQEGPGPLASEIPSSNSKDDKTIPDPDTRTQYDTEKPCTDLNKKLLSARALANLVSDSRRTVRETAYPDLEITHPLVIEELKKNMDDGFQTLKKLNSSNQIAVYFYFYQKQDPVHYQHDRYAWTSSLNPENPNEAYAYSAEFKEFELKPRTQALLPGEGRLSLLDYCSEKP